MWQLLNWADGNEGYHVTKLISWNAYFASLHKFQSSCLLSYGQTHVCSCTLPGTFQILYTLKITLSLLGNNGQYFCATYPKLILPRSLTNSVNPKPRKPKPSTEENRPKMTQKAVGWNLLEKKPTVADLNRKRFIKRTLDWSQTRWKNWGSRDMAMQSKIMLKITPLTWWIGTPWLSSHSNELYSLWSCHCLSSTLDTGPDSTTLGTTEIQPSDATSTADKREFLKVPPILGWAQLTLCRLGHMSFP